MANDLLHSHPTACCFTRYSQCMCVHECMCVYLCVCVRERGRKEGRWRVRDRGRGRGGERERELEGGGGVREREGGRESCLDSHQNYYEQLL